MTELVHQPPTDDEVFEALVRNGKYWGKGEAVAFARARYKKDPENKLIEWTDTLYEGIGQAAGDGQLINVLRGFFALSKLIQPLIARGVSTQSVEEVISIASALWVWSHFARRVPFCNVDAAYWVSELIVSRQIHKTSGINNAVILLLYARWHIYAPDGDSANAPGYLALAHDQLSQIHNQNQIAVVLKELATMYWYLGEQKMARKYAAQLCNLDNLDPGMERQGIAAVRHMFFG